MTRSILTVLVLVLLTGPLAVETPAQEPESREIGRLMNGLRTRWNEMEGLYARFIHTFEWVLAGETRQTRGELWLSGRDRFRIETGERTLVSDGEVLHDYDPDQEQVLLNDVDPRRGILTQQQFFAAYTEDVDVSWVGEEGRGEEQRVVLDLDRGAERDPSRVRVWVDPSRLLVTRAEFDDGAGNHHIYSMTELRTGPQPAERFTFEVPEGVTVVDMRTPGGRR
ncbi:MAG: outer membrane lipoprotein carrier protein LolA [bacterium]